MARSRNKKKKPAITTQTAVILAGSAVCIGLILVFFIIIRSSIPRDRGFRDFDEPPLVQTPDEAWTMLRGKWKQAYNDVGGAGTVEYEFTADQRVIVRNTPNIELIRTVSATHIDDGEIIFELRGADGNPDGELNLWFETPKILFIEFDEYHKKK